MSTESIETRLERMESLLLALIDKATVKEFYSVEEFAKLTGKASFTIREHCRHGRIHAEKRSYKRGKSAEWKISHQELVRVQNEGLLPG